MYLRVKASYIRFRLLFYYSCWCGLSTFFFFFFLLINSSVFSECSMKCCMFDRIISVKRNVLKIILFESKFSNLYSIYLIRILCYDFKKIMISFQCFFSTFMSYVILFDIVLTIPYWYSYIKLKYRIILNINFNIFCKKIKH